MWHENPDAAFARTKLEHGPVEAAFEGIEEAEQHCLEVAGPDAFLCKRRARNVIQTFGAPTVVLSETERKGDPE